MGDGSIKSNDLRAAALTPDPQTLEDACLGFHRRFRRFSSKHLLTWPQALAFVALIGGLTWAVIEQPGWTWRIAYALSFALFAISIVWRWFAAARLEPLRGPVFTPRDGHWPTYTILCPLHREANVVFDLVTALRRIEYPTDALDILLLVEGDDPETITAALAAANAPHIQVVIVPVAAPRTKPKALNVGLALARGEFVTVYDAEDRPHPSQLRAAVAAFEGGGDDLACVQAPLAIDNGHASWISRQFAAEYAIQFRQILPLLAELNMPLPLGGTSNHFRTETLRAAGGWDPYNVTEDAELGYRLARLRLRTGIIAPPTYEEAPITLDAWGAQRSRWIKGHMQTWLTLMRDPIRSAREMGFWAFLSAHLVLGGGVAASFVHGWLALLLVVAALTPLDLLSHADITLALSGYSIAIFAAFSAVALTGDTAHFRAALGMPFYWPLHSIAALMALGGLIFRPHHWAKTEHGVSERHRVIAVRSPSYQSAASSAQAVSMSRSA